MASLRDLGLSEYESRVYRSLLRIGPTTAKELSQASDVPMGRIYDVLGSLEQYRLVRTQAAGRPKKYVAVEADVALDRLLSEKKSALDERASRYEDIVETLQGELEATEPISGQFWTAAVGPEETLELLVERIAAAEEEVIVVGGSPAAGLDLKDASNRVVTAMAAALDRGVDVQLLITPTLVEELPDEVGKAYNDRLSEYDNYAVRTDESVDGTFNLIDGVEVCLEVPNPLDPRQTFAMINLKDRQFATDVREVFTPRWERADPLELEPTAPSS
jgi:sugar-specific transcriptional regulator TrmB